MEDVGRVPTELVSANLEPATIPTLDGWIESLMQCKQLAESDVQRLCEKVRRCRRIPHLLPLPFSRPPAPGLVWHRRAQSSPPHLFPPSPLYTSYLHLHLHAVTSRRPPLEAARLLPTPAETRHVLTCSPRARHVRCCKKSRTCNRWYVFPQGGKGIEPPAAPPPNLRVVLSID